VGAGGGRVVEERVDGNCGVPFIRGGERGVSKRGITSTRLRASVFPPQYPASPLDPDNPRVRNSRFARAD
jgi:hypothetical protein